MKIKVNIPNIDRIRRKGNGGIFVNSVEDKEKVLNIIRGIDEEEYNTYLPKNFLKIFDTDYNILEYTHKFDIDIGKLINECNLQNIDIIVYSCNEYNFEFGLTLERAIEQKLNNIFKNSI